MATSTKYNDFGGMVIENRPTMTGLDFESSAMTRKEWINYLSICDQLATTCYNYLADGTSDRFPAFRTALHSLFSFMGMDTRILALDAYTVRFIPAIVAYKVVKSQAYKDAEKAVRGIKKAMEWAISVSEVSADQPDAVLFPKAENGENFASNYFDKDEQDNYNTCVKLWNANGKHLTVADMTAEQTRLEGVVEDLGAEKWNCYKDYKNPMLSSTGKMLKHCPASIRKNIEDALADLLTARNLMTIDQLDKEEKQIKGGRK